MSGPNLHVHDEILALYRHGEGEAGIRRIEELEGAWLPPGIQPGDLGVLLAAGYALEGHAAGAAEALRRAHPIYVVALSPHATLLHVDALFQHTGAHVPRALLLELALENADALELDTQEIRSILFLRAYVMSLRDHHREAADAYRALLGVPLPAAERAALLNNLAWEQLSAGYDLPEAHEVAEEALKISPENSFIRFTYGATILEAGGDPADALGYLEHRMETLHEVDPKHHARCLFYIAWAAGACGKGGLAGQARSRLEDIPGTELYLGRLDEVDEPR